MTEPNEVNEQIAKHLPASPWQAWRRRNSPKNAQRMIDALQLCLDTYFKEWKK